MSEKRVEDNLQGSWVELHYSSGPLGGAASLESQRAEAEAPGSTEEGEHVPGSAPEVELVPGSTLEGKLVPGSTLEGELVPGSTLEGELVPGSTLEGELVPGSTLEGELVPGSTLEGELVPGSTLEGKLVPGSTLEGKLVPGSTLEGELVPGCTLEGEQVPGCTLEGELVPGCTLEGEQVPGLPQGGEQVPGLTQGGEQVPGLTQREEQVPGLTQGGEQVPGLTLASAQAPIQGVDLEKMLLEAQHESGRSSSRGSLPCDSPPRPQTPLHLRSGSEAPSSGEKYSSQSDEDYLERRQEVENLMKKNADWIWDWSSRPENLPPREFLLKHPKRATPLSIRNTRVMKKGGIFSADFLRVFLPSLFLSHILAIGLGVYIGRRLTPPSSSF